MITLSREIAPNVVLSALSSGRHNTPPSILIPVHVAETASDSELATYVRQMIEVAYLADVRNIAEWIIYERDPDMLMFVVERHPEDIVKLENYAGRDNLADEALAAIAEARQRDTYRDTTPNTRKEVRNKYKRFYATLVERDGELCAYCSATENLQIDHIVPVIKGGTNDLENLQLLCATCNGKKSDR